MNFSDYCSLIAKSVAETGYDSFFPSACVPGLLKDQYYVLDGELSEEGEERRALAWAEALPKSSGNMFLAFRGGKRRVTVLEMRGHSMVDGLVIQVNPYSEKSE